MRRKTQEEFLSEVDSTVEILSEYTNWNCSIKCRCKLCGREWETSAASLLHGSACKECGYKRTAIKRKITHDEYMLRLKDSNENVVLLEKYDGAHNHKKFKCLNCGKIWMAEPTKILNNLSGCPECGNLNRGKSNALTQEEFILRANKNAPSIKIVGRYVNNNTLVKMRCIKHNIDFDGDPRCILYKGGNVCPKCNESVGEKILDSILDSFNIKYNTQFIIDECIFETKLKFDAFDIENNIAYEYQGEQHYKPIDFAGNGDDWANKNFEITQLRDDAKRKYCKEHDIPLIEIPYWERDNMRDFLIEKWKEIDLNIA